MFHLRLLLTSLQGLRQNLLRSMLATLGVIIGVGAVVSAVSVLEGARRNILEQFESLGADQIMVFNGTSRRSHRRVQKPSLMPEDATRIEEENDGHIIATSPQVTGFAQIKYYEKNEAVGVLGAVDSYSEMNDYRVAEGRFITREDVRGQAMVAVLGHGVAQNLFGARTAVGKTAKINGKSFAIIGVMEERGAMGFTNVDDQVIIPLSTAMRRVMGLRYLQVLVCQCSDALQMDACIEGIKKTLRGAHRINAGDEDDFTVFTQEQFKRELGQAAKIFAVVLNSIAGIALVVGAIGIMNIMLVSVTERTREIGVRIAVGARRMDVLKQFLTEASVISLCGGALGVACGWAIANFLSEFTQVLTTYTPPIIIVYALIMAFAVGIISGIYPAVRAARLDPVQALRFE